MPLCAIYTFTCILHTIAKRYEMTRLQWLHSTLKTQQAMVTVLAERTQFRFMWHYKEWKQNLKRRICDAGFFKLNCKIAYRMKNISQFHFDPLTAHNSNNQDVSWARPFVFDGKWFFSRSSWSFAFSFPLLFFIGCRSVCDQVKIFQYCSLCWWSCTWSYECITSR